MRRLVDYGMLVITALYFGGFGALAFAPLPNAPHSRLEASPIVSKIDPPSWFVDFFDGEVQLLIRGESLTGSTLESDTSGVEIASQRVNASGTYLIAYLSIASSVQAGPVSLRVTNDAGSVSVPFALRARTIPSGRFSGLTPDDVIYLVMPDRFANGDSTNDETAAPGTTFDRANPNFYHGGDIRGLIEHLPYLADLGVTAIWLNPVYDNSDEAQPFQPYHGYHATDYYSVENHFGTLDDFVDLVDAAHTLGIKVVQDEVANHTSPSHPWLDSYPTPTWYNGTPVNHLVNPFDIGSIVSPGGNQNVRRATLEGWFIDLLPDLNQNDPDLARYEIQNSLWWIERTGIDAIRQDTLPYVPRTFWNTWMTAIKNEYPAFTVVGEVFDGNPDVTSFFQGGVARYDGVDSKVDSVFDFPMYFAILSAARGEDTLAISRVIANDGDYPNPTILVPHAGNHDVARLFRNVGSSIKRLMIAQTLLLTMRGIPQLYYGDEIALDGGSDPDNRRDFPGGFPGDPRNAFTPSGRSKGENKVFDNLRRLIALRAASPALRGQSTSVLFAGTSGVAYVRQGGEQKALVVCNVSTSEQSLRINVGSSFAAGTRLRDSVKGKVKTKVKGGFVTVSVQGLSSVIMVPE